MMGLIEAGLIVLVSYAAILLVLAIWSLLWLGTPALKAKEEEEERA